MRFKDKSVIVTGGGGKIGKAYAMAFAKEGAKVSLPDIASADHVVKAIQDMGGTAISSACDVSDEKSVKMMVDETAKQFGGVDILVNNAAYFMTVWKGPFWEMAVDEFDKAMAVNVRGSWLCAKAAFPSYEEAREGQNHQYFLRHRFERQSELYSLRHFQRSNYRDDPRHGAGAWRLHICVNTVAPGFVETEGRQVEPAFSASRVANRSLKRVQVENDLVGTVLFLASPESDFMTGQLLNVDGGANFIG